MTESILDLSFKALEHLEQLPETQDTAKHTLDELLSDQSAALLVLNCILVDIITEPEPLEKTIRIAAGLTDGIRPDDDFQSADDLLKVMRNRGTPNELVTTVTEAYRKFTQQSLVTKLATHHLIDVIRLARATGRLDELRYRCSTHGVREESAVLRKERANPPPPTTD